MPSEAETLLTEPQSASDPAAPAATGEQTAADKPAEQSATATPEGDKPAEGGKPAEDEKATEGAPEKYEFASPEGQELDQEVLSEFETLARERNMTQEEAQHFVDLGNKVVQKAMDKLTSQIEAEQAKWAEASTTDAEFGGDKLTESQGFAKEALKTFGTPELTKLLDESKLGNHPEVIRVFVRVGKAISQDQHITGSKSNTPQDQAERMFPSMANKS